MEVIEKNPLDCSDEPDDVSRHNIGKILNKRGRPKKQNSINFGPQPKSLVAQMLLKSKTETGKKSDVMQSHLEQNEPIYHSIEFNDEESDRATESNDIVCEVCCHKSSCKKEHEKHTNIHKQFACDYVDCSYSSKLQCNLIKHRRVHTNEKPYFCDRCAFRTNFVNSLKSHKRIHTSERPYECKHCSYKCNSSSNLKKHCLHRHPESR